MENERISGILWPDGRDHANPVYETMKLLPMNIHITKYAALTALPAIAIFAGCAQLAPKNLFSGVAHTPPGTAVDVALARRPELVRMPLSPASASVRAASVAAPTGGVKVPAVEPDLPSDDRVGRVADAYSRGNFCMQAGNDADAITAFEETVKMDPTFTEAWQNLAALYEKRGDEKKAVEAYKRAKKLTNG
jgi:tetratricopeptide (TPR) repeat protein